MKALSILCALFVAVSAQASLIVNDSLADIDPGINNGAGTMDIVSMEVAHTATDIIFALTVNGNVSTTDWGNFMIGIATGGTGTTTGNGWNRPINLDSPIGGMDFWIGSWVNAGGGSQLWSYNGATWDGPAALAGYTFTPGAVSLMTYTVSRGALGLTGDDTFYFDAYSSGGGGTDSAVDALSNPNVSITAWDQVYTSSVAPGNGLNVYTIPEPSTAALLGLGALCGLGFVRRVRRA
ncbi:MAG: PEP-CTERM sorting domain-containing protein [Verrucomicrobia bacterium]|nr:PEP-CTERM sorting domain-containing protein [Verrucomicrobiota bacterium]